MSARHWRMVATLAVLLTSAAMADGGGSPVMPAVQTTRDVVAAVGLMPPAGWCEAFGQGMLTSGRAYVFLDTQFLKESAVDRGNPFTVFVQLCGDCGGVYVTKGSTGFEVRELQGGTTSVPFDYRVVARRASRGAQADALPSVWMGGEPGGNVSPAAYSPGPMPKAGEAFADDASDEDEWVEEAERHEWMRWLQSTDAP